MKIRVLVNTTRPGSRRGSHLKKSATILLLATATSAAYAQGKVSLQNDGGSPITLSSWNVRGADMPVAGQPVATTGPLPSGIVLSVGLYAGTSSTALSLVSSEILNPVGGTGNAPGTIPIRHIMLPFPGGFMAYFQVRVWDSAYANYDQALGWSYTGENNIFTMTPGTSIAYPSITTGGGSSWTAVGNETPLIVGGACLGPDLIIISFQPVNQTAVRGGTANFSVGAYSTCGNPVSYQWRFNDSGIPGATSSSYQITNVQPANAGTYSVQVWDCCSVGISSQSATLTVLSEPNITSQPQSQTNVVGATADLVVGATGAPPLSYQWFFNDTSISGAGNSDLQLPNLQTSQSGTYRVIITNTYGAVTSSPALLTVLASPPTIVMAPWNHTAVVGRFMDFTVGAAGALPLTYQWFFNGSAIAGATGADLHLSNLQLSQSGNYAVAVTNAFGAVTSAPARLTVISEPLLPSGTVVAWGDNSDGQIAVPAGLSNVIAVAAGTWHSLALEADGVVHAWGYNSIGQATVPPDLVDVIAISAGSYHSLALRSDGSAVAWGWNYFGQTNIPPGLNDVIAIAAGGKHSLALRSDGTVVGWGQTEIPTGLRGVIAIAAGARHSMALKFDGTVVAWGDNANVPPGLAGVVGIAAGGDHSLALKSDGTVAAWGGNYYGQSTVPPGLYDVTGIAAGEDYFNTPDSHSLALKSDGTVVAWGDNTHGQSQVPAGLDEVFAISAGGYHNLALVAQAPAILAQPISQTAELGYNVEFRANALGSPPLAYQWFLNGTNAISGLTTNACLRLNDIQFSQTGAYFVVVSNAFGVVASSPAMLSVIAPVERRPVPALTLVGQTGTSLHLENRNVIDITGNWLALDTVTLTNPPQWYFDLTAPLPPQGFYRAWHSELAPPPTLDLHVIPAITLAGTIGNSVRLDYINQFGPIDAWGTLATVTLTNTTQLYFDTSVIGQPPRLYRIVPLP